MYRISFHFFDGHKLDIDVEDEMLDTLLDALGQNRTYFNKDKTQGFWLQGEKVRYFNINKTGEPPCQKSLPSEAVNASPT